MGWSSGSYLMDEVITATKRAIKTKAARVKFYVDVIEAFEGADWDTQSDCLGQDPAFDAALKKLHPSWGNDEDEE